MMKVEKLFFKDVFYELNQSFDYGKIYLIFGDNGSGKTTLLYLLQGIYKPDRGNISFNGEVFNYNRKWLSYLRGKVSLLFQNPDYQVIGLTVKDDIGFGLKMNGCSRERIDEEVDRILTSYNILNLKYKRTDQLSFGEKKKVSIASISILNPDIILLDEPYAGLDIEGRGFVDEYIKKSKDQGKTVIITSHEVGEFMNKVDEILIIKNRNLFKIDSSNEEFIPVYLRNMFLLSKYGYFDKLIPEEFIKGLS